MEYAIETFSLTKVFSDWWGRDKVYAVEDLTLQIKQNEVFGLLGPNGSGKTTTIKLLLGLLHPTKGRAHILGGRSSDPKISARIGFMPEESYLYRYLNARETLDFYGRLFHLPSNVRKNRIEALLDMVGLKAVANRAVGTFSKGMARRIGLAQALINDPEVLILDEPTTGLDPIGTRQIKDLIIQLAKRGKTILLCSHLLADVEDVCDRIAILYGGKVQAKGHVRNLLTQSNKKQIMTGDISDEALEKIEQIIKNEQHEYSVNSPMEKLESFFIKTVTAAQMEGKKTSGAISHADKQISNFLAAKPQVENILDKLVSSPTSNINFEKSVKTETVEKPETAEEKIDKVLLKELTEKPKSVVKTETVKPQSMEPEPEKVDQNILDQLTSSDPEDNAPGKSDGGVGNA